MKDYIYVYIIGDMNFKKSISSFVMIGRAMSWQSKLQKYIALSSTKAIYYYYRIW